MTEYRARQAHLMTFTDEQLEDLFLDELRAEFIDAWVNTLPWPSGQQDRPDD